MHSEKAYPVLCVWYIIIICAVITYYVEYNFCIYVLHVWACGGRHMGMRLLNIHPLTTNNYKLHYYVIEQKDNYNIILQKRRLYILY